MQGNLPDTLWPRLSEFVAQHTGLHFPPERRQDLQRGVTGAAAEFGFSDTADCADWLLSAPLTPPQLQILTNHLTVGETYFFREQKSFDALAQQILPELIRSRRGREQRLRLWSAACSTGEEAYSLAILLQQLLPDWRDWRLTILATDINERSLQKAASGVFGEWSLRESPPWFKDRYFTRTVEGRFALLPEIKQCVNFARLNLAQDGFPSLATNTNAMDVILCRNLLMYFTAPRAQRLVQKLRDALVDDGWLLVSPCECSQALFRGFSTVYFPGAILYRKGGAAQQALEPSPWHRMQAPLSPSSEDALSPFDASTPRLVAPEALPAESDLSGPMAASAARSEVSKQRAAAEALYRQGRYAEVTDLLLSLTVSEAARSGASPSGSPPNPIVLSLLTRALANQGKLTDALAWSQRWIVADKLDAAAHYLHAMVLQELGERASARRSLQRAVYVDPHFTLAHFALGNIERSDARSAPAKRHFEVALQSLRGRAPTEPLPESDGMTAGRLGEILTALLAVDCVDRPFEEARYERR